MGCAGLFVATVAVMAAGAAAAQSARGPALTGRYAFDAAECKAKDYFATIRETSFDLPVYSCKGVTYDQIESSGGLETYRVTAKSCVGEMAVKGKPNTLSILREKGKIRFRWADGSTGEPMMRCGV